MPVMKDTAEMRKRSAEVLKNGSMAEFMKREAKFQKEEAKKRSAVKKTGAKKKK